MIQATKRDVSLIDPKLIDRTQLHEDNKIGQGGYGRVYPYMIGNENVAIKVISGVKSDDTMNKVNKEIDVACSVSHNLKCYLEFISCLTEMLSSLKDTARSALML